MREEEKRKNKISKEIECFLDQDNKEKSKHITVSSAYEASMIKQDLYERDAQVEVVDEISLNGKISFTLKKM